jgi:hypothetical protein
MTLPPNARTAIVAALAAGIFVFSFLLRFNDPGGSFAGLTDDHFFISCEGGRSFGDLPVRDFRSRARSTTSPRRCSRCSVSASVSEVESRR